ncbi:MAG: SRPBCC family protein [Rhizobacter sp.]|nr:SRPBCC family protein [Rhizobacter sp.]
MLKKIALVIVALIAVVLIYAATRPDSFSVQRTATIKAPPEKVFALINDFHNWPAWSPWEKLDPAMKRTHTGANAGQGAVYAWLGNSDVGEGRMEIVESVPSSRVGIKLDFITPFESKNTTLFTLQPQGDSTQVTWLMQGPAPYVTKLMTVFVSMDKMIGKDFETGLANMKAAAEK